MPNPGTSRAKSPHPSVFLLLNLPRGFTGGYITVVLPYLATKAGLPVFTVASIVAVAISPKALKIVWAPLADVGLTLKRWYVIGASIAGGMLVLQSLIPIRASTVSLLAVGLFITECGANLLAAPLGALMADTMPDELKGQAAGWYQLGGKVGTALGGGAGLWLAVHTGAGVTAGLALGLGCIGCSVGLVVLDEPERRLPARAVARLKETGLELWRMLKSRDGLLVAVLAVCPIGVSGVSDFWSAVANEWGVSAKTVVMVTGFATAATACAGSLIAGWWADHADRRFVYLATGALVAAASAALAIGPHVSRMFVVGTLAQNLFIGMADAALYALILQVIGRSAAATKFAVLAALGNVGELYVTVTSGWVHDRWGTITMLMVESILAVIFIVALAPLLMSRRSRKTMVVTRQ